MEFWPSVNVLCIFLMYFTVQNISVQAMSLPFSVLEFFSFFYYSFFKLDCVMEFNFHNFGGYSVTSIVLLYLITMIDVLPPAC